MQKRRLNGAVTFVRLRTRIRCEGEACNNGWLKSIDRRDPIRCTRETRRSELRLAGDGGLQQYQAVVIYYERVHATFGVAKPEKF